MFPRSRGVSGWISRAFSGTQRGGSRSPGREISYLDSQIQPRRRPTYIGGCRNHSHVTPIGNGGMSTTEVSAAKVPPQSSRPPPSRACLYRAGDGQYRDWREKVRRGGLTMRKAAVSVSTRRSPLEGKVARALDPLLNPHLSPRRIGQRQSVIVYGIWDAKGDHCASFRRHPRISVCMLRADRKFAPRPGAYFVLAESVSPWIQEGMHAKALWGKPWRTIPCSTFR